MVSKGERRWGGIKKEFEILHMKASVCRTGNKDLLHSTRNYIQYYVTNHNGKDSDARKDCRREEKGMTEDEMVGWHHQLNGHEFE